ncbi:MAG: hypothetical protein AAGE93_18680, partial [Bacteroidota bacterium]
WSCSGTVGHVSVVGQWDICQVGHEAVVGQWDICQVGHGAVAASSYDDRWHYPERPTHRRRIPDGR